MDDDIILANTERWLCTVRYGYSSLFFSFCLTSIALTHGEWIVCVDMAMDTLYGHGHVTWRIGHTPDSFTGGSLLSPSIFHYLHRQHTPWFRKQLRTFTCKSIKIIAPILLVCIELNQATQNVTSVGNKLKPMTINLFTVTTAPTGSIVTVVKLMTANTGS